MRVTFRPHHFLCTLGFQGVGYSPAFVSNYKNIVKALHENEELPIHIISKTDSICKACPHQRGAQCEKEEKIQALDARHKEILSLEPGSVLSWKQAKEKLKERMSLPDFHRACEGCEWKSLGVCEEALRKLRGEACEEKANT